MAKETGTKEPTSQWEGAIMERSISLMQTGFCQLRSNIETGRNYAYDEKSRTFESTGTGRNDTRTRQQYGSKGSFVQGQNDIRRPR